MDLTFFGLRESPFRLGPDPAFLFESEPHRAALAHLIDGVLRGSEPVFLTGEPGSGKTTLLRVLAERLEPRVTVAYLPNWRLDLDGVVDCVLRGFGVDTVARTVADRLSALGEFLRIERQEGRTLALLIDDAENLTPEAFDAVSRLARAGPSDGPLRVVMALQSETAVLLSGAPKSTAGDQDGGPRCRIGRLSPDESRDYIHHRLRIAGAADVRLFTEAAIRRIASYAQGTPRLINIACDHCLVSAYAVGKTRVDVETVQAAIDELESGDHPSARVPRDGAVQAPGVVWVGRAGVAVLVLLLLVTLALSASALGWFGAILK
jgi:general secretion pathway protein A